MTKRYDLSKIMRRAWELVKKAALTISEGLRRAWMEAKGMEGMTMDQKVEALEKIGFKRWTKGEMDRMYINPSKLGLVIEWRSTGSIKAGYLNGDRVSNSEANRLRNAKVYIDLKTWEVIGCDELRPIAEKMMAEAIA